MAAMTKVQALAVLDPTLAQHSGKLRLVGMQAPEAAKVARDALALLVQAEKWAGVPPQADPKGEALRQIGNALRVLGI